MSSRNLIFRKLLLLPFLAFAISAQAYKVTNLTATCSNGQVFLTWKNPTATNLKYKVYRSLTKFTSSSQLTTANFLGYVRDNSGQNIRKSTLQDQDFYFTVNPSDGTLASDHGLYVVTCNDNQRHYYAVMVVNLSTGVEAKTITLGENSLNSSLKEHKGTPQPILQAIINQPNGDINYEYVIFGNNQDVAGYPAFNNCGSYGYNFTLIEREPGTSAPLFIKFDDDDPFRKLGDDICSECNILALDDWLPNGENSYWVGFNTGYDMYSDENPVKTTGIIRTYTQNRLREIITWAASQPKVDGTKTYSTGYSHNGFGALLTSVMMPELLAATDQTSAPILIKAVGGSFREGQWCKGSYNLKSDVVNPNTGDTILIWDLLDIRTMMKMNYNRSLPFMSGVNGKQDVTVGWVQLFHWFDSVDVNRHGGIWYWDQRNHTGGGKNFTSDEIEPDFLRFSTTQSYPAFSYCSVNQDPGNGDANDGDDYGALNGYLDWEDVSISDQQCDYSIDCFIKDFYVDGDLQPKYDSCTADITMRRLQNFKPTNGQVIDWKVKNSTNKIIQQGSLTYSNTSPLTIYGAKIYKSGGTISFSINGCQKSETLIEESSSQPLVVARTSDGYLVTVNLNTSANVEINLIDMMGRIVSSQMKPMQNGSNTFALTMNSGAYVLQVKAEGFSESKKLVF